MECISDADRVLTRHCIDNEERVVRLDCRRDVCDLTHHLFINGETTSSVNNDNVFA